MISALRGGMLGEICQCKHNILFLLLSLRIICLLLRLNAEVWEGLRVLDLECRNTGMEGHRNAGIQEHASAIYLWGQKTTEGLREGTASLWWHVLTSTQATELIFGWCITY